MTPEIGKWYFVKWYSERVEVVKIVAHKDSQTVVMDMPFLLTHHYSLIAESDVIAPFPTRRMRLARLLIKLLGLKAV